MDDRKLLTLCLLMCNASAFTVQNRPRLSPIIQHNKLKTSPHRLSQPTTVHHPIPHRTQTSLNSISAASSLFQRTSNITPVARVILLPLLAITVFFFYRRIFYPNSSPDPSSSSSSSSSHPLPPGKYSNPFFRNNIFSSDEKASPANLSHRRIFYPNSSPDPPSSQPLLPVKFSNPFFGNNIFSPDETSSPAKFWLNRSKSLDHLNVNKFYFTGRAMAVRGLNSIKQSFDRASVKTQSMFNDAKLLMSHAEEEHPLLSKLVGIFMSQSISKAMPALQEAAMEQVDKILEDPRVVTMSDVCSNNFTLDVAWKRILGLNLKEEGEIMAFHKMVEDWIHGLFSPSVMNGVPGLRFARAYEAKKLLDELIMEKIDQLERNGPDGSILGAMVFARDEEDNRKLTREQLLDMALSLILAGSDISETLMAVI